MAKKSEFDISFLYDLDMERAILSSIFTNSNVLGDIYDLIQASDFYLKGHSDIFKAMVDCLNSDQPVAVSFIKNKLGESYNEAIMNEIFSVNPIVDIEKYASELKEKSIKRGLISLAQNVPSKVSQDKASRDIVDDISSEIFNLTDNKNRGAVKDSSEIIGNFLEYLKIQSSEDLNKTVGLKTGFRELDFKTNGFKKGNLIIVAARPAMGKTTLCLNFINEILKNDGGAVLFSLEMDAEEIMMRMLAAKTSIPLQNIISAQMDDEQITNLSNACEYMSSRKFFVYDGKGGINIHQIRTQLRKLKMTHPEISLCVIDYIGLMTNTSNFMERHLQVADISRGLKLLARELDMPIVALSQLNRSLESRPDKRPMMSDLRESGAIEQDADIILFVYRDDVYREREEKEKQKQADKEGKTYTSNFNPNKIEEKAEIIIGKNRNGETGIVNVVFQKRFSRFVDASFNPVESVSFDG